MDQDLRKTASQSRNKPGEAFVGSGSARNWVRVLRQTDRVIWKTSPKTQLPFLAICCSAGLGVLVALWLHPASGVVLAKMPRLVIVGVLLVAFVIFALLLHNLINRHRIELIRQTGDLYFYKRVGGPACLHLGKQEIGSFAVGKEGSRHSSSGKPRNFVLSAVCRDGRTIRLCTSADWELLKSLRADLENSVLRK